ncbi:MAG: hypothetical protein JNL76_08475 [Alphaproteobacteria bacterium]|nr:hypothetical protein [Alphaproteobacteria bacterium]
MNSAIFAASADHSVLPEDLKDQTSNHILNPVVSQDVRHLITLHDEGRFQYFETTDISYKAVLDLAAYLQRTLGTSDRTGLIPELLAQAVRFIKSVPAEQVFIRLDVTEQKQKIAEFNPAHICAYDADRSYGTDYLQITRRLTIHGSTSSVMNNADLGIFLERGFRKYVILYLGTQKNDDIQYLDPAHSMALNLVLTGLEDNENPDLLQEKVHDILLHDDLSLLQTELADLQLLLTEFRNDLTPKTAQEIVERLIELPQKIESLLQTGAPVELINPLVEQAESFLTDSMIQEIIEHYNISSGNFTSPTDITPPGIQTLKKTAMEIKTLLRQLGNDPEAETKKDIPPKPIGLREENDNLLEIGGLPDQPIEFINPPAEQENGLLLNPLIRQSVKASISSLSREIETEPSPQIIAIKPQNTIVPNVSNHAPNEIDRNIFEEIVVTTVIKGDRIGDLNLNERRITAEKINPTHENIKNNEGPKARRETEIRRSVKSNDTGGGNSTPNAPHQSVQSRPQLALQPIRPILGSPVINPALKALFSLPASMPIAQAIDPTSKISPRSSSFLLRPSLPQNDNQPREIKKREHAEKSAPKTKEQTEPRTEITGRITPSPVLSQTPPLTAQFKKVCGKTGLENCGCAPKSPENQKALAGTIEKIQNEWDQNSLSKAGITAAEAAKTLLILEKNKASSQQNLQETVISTIKAEKAVSEALRQAHPTIDTQQINAQIQALLNKREESPKQNGGLENGGLRGVFEKLRDPFNRSAKGEKGLDQRIKIQTSTLPQGDPKPFDF